MTFNLQRIGFLIINDIKSKGSLYGLTLGLCFMVVAFYFYNENFSILETISSIGTGYSGFNNFGNSSGSEYYKFHFTWFPQLFLVASSIITSFSFSEYSKSNSASFHLGLPASTLEKWAAKILFAIVLSPIAIIIFYELFIIATSIGSSEIASRQVKVHMNDPYIWKNIINLIPWQCFIFLGALIFKRFTIGKLLLTGMLLVIGFNTVILLSLIVQNPDIDFFKNFSINNLSSVDSLLSAAGYHVKAEKSFLLSFSNTTYLNIGCIVALIISYLRFSELDS